MKISTATSVFVNYPLQNAAEEIPRAGYDGIDIWCGRPHLYRKDFSPAELSSLRTWLQGNRLNPVSCLPAFFRYPYSLSSPYSAIRKDSVGYMVDTIENAAAVGAPIVLVVPTHSLHGQSSTDARSWFIDGLAQACRSAESAGIRLGIEVLYPALSDYMNTTADALSMIREIGSPALGVVLDTGHLNLSGEDPTEAFKNTRDLLLQIHVNDNDSHHQQNNIPGDGCFDFPGFVKFLKENQYDGYLTVEIGWQYSFNPVPAAKQAVDRVRAYLSVEE
jgi:fructoselysine 3-epimerase